MGNIQKPIGSGTLHILYQQLQAGGISQEEFKTLAQTAATDKVLDADEQALFNQMIAAGEIPKGKAITALTPELKSIFEPVLGHGLQQTVDALAPGYQRQLTDRDDIETRYLALKPETQKQFNRVLEAGPFGSHQLQVMRLLKQSQAEEYLNQTDNQGQSLMANLAAFLSEPQIDQLAKMELLQALTQPESLDKAYQLSHGSVAMLRENPAEFVGVVRRLQTNSTGQVSKKRAPADVKAALEPVFKILAEIKPDGKDAVAFLKGLSNDRIRLSDAPLNYLGGLVHAPHEAAWVVTQNKLLGPVGNPFSLKSRLVLNDSFWQRSDGEKVSALYHEYIHSQQPPGYGVSGNHEKHAYQCQCMNALEGEPLYIQRGNFHDLIEANLEAENMDTDPVAMIKALDEKFWTSQSDFATMRQQLKSLSNVEKAQVIQHLMQQSWTNASQETLIYHILQDTPFEGGQFLDLMGRLDMADLAAELEDNAQAAQVGAWLAEGLIRARKPQRRLKQFLRPLAQAHREGALVKWVKNERLQANQRDILGQVDAELLKDLAQALMKGDTNAAEERAVYTLVANTTWPQFGKMMDAPFRKQLQSELSQAQYQQIQTWYWELAKHL